METQLGEVHRVEGRFGIPSGQIVEAHLAVDIDCMVKGGILDYHIAG
jgi:hypothetical protein